MRHNIDLKTVEGFGQEWSAFDQTSLPPEEAHLVFGSYFSLVDFSSLPTDALALDVGCGSGRWAKLVGPRVGSLVLADPSPDALAVAERNLSGLANCSFVCADAENLPVPDGAFDLVYSLGVLHHVPDTAAAISALARKLKPGAPLVLYLYYKFDNRPWWFKFVWTISDFGRRLISRLPFALRRKVADLIALLVYVPLAEVSRWAESKGKNVDAFPLSSYRDKSVYTMRTDALDRFGTRLEQRFTRDEIHKMMAFAGLVNIRFAEGAPYWRCVGSKPSSVDRIYTP